MAQSKVKAVPTSNDSPPPSRRESYFSLQRSSLPSSSPRVHSPSPAADRRLTTRSATLDYSEDTISPPRITKRRSDDVFSVESDGLAATSRFLQTIHDDLNQLGDGSSIESNPYRDNSTTAGTSPHRAQIVNHVQPLRERHSTPATNMTAEDHIAPPAISHRPLSAAPSPHIPIDRQESQGRTIPPKRSKASAFMAQLYTASYLIFFSILGTLARLGLQSLTFYPGAPVATGVLWANFAGSFIMGFLAEDCRLFREEWGVPTSHEVDLAQGTITEVDVGEKSQVGASPFDKSNRSRVKKTIPLYIGLTTGFCGSFTSFSAFMRDVFFALSNDLPTPPSNLYPQGAVLPPNSISATNRNAGYSVMAVLAVIIITIGLCISAFRAGTHLAAYLDPITPTLPHRFTRLFLDRLVVLVGLGAWFGAVIMSIWPPDRPSGPASRGSWSRETWRGSAIFALVFAPLGCLLRYFVSLKLNPISPSFPLGTFAVNIFGTAVLGMSYDLQHIDLGGAGIGGGRVACQVLQGVMDGFDGCLTTVSTLVAELVLLRRNAAYAYGIMSVVMGLGVLVIVMGSVRWGVGWSEDRCF